MLLDLLPLFEDEGGSFTRALPELVGYGAARSTFDLASEVSGYAEIYGATEVAFALEVVVTGHEDKAFTRRRDEEALMALGAL